jgi:hypothetical protein
MEGIRKEIEDRSYVPVSSVQVYRCECQRCAHVWHTLQKTRPKTCSNCRSPWWDRPKTVSGPGPVEKGKKRKHKTGRKPGRPRKHAREEVAAGRPDAIGESAVAEVPEVPVELLGAMGGFETASGGFDGGDAGSIEGAVPMEASGDSGSFVPAVHTGGSDQGVAVGQSVDGGGRAGFDGAAEFVRTVICTDPAHHGGTVMHGCCTGWSDDDYDD